MAVNIWGVVTLAHLLHYCVLKMFKNIKLLITKGKLKLSTFSKNIISQNIKSKLVVII